MAFQASPTQSATPHDYLINDPLAGDRARLFQLLIPQEVLNYHVSKYIATAGWFASLGSYGRRTQEVIDCSQWVKTKDFRCALLHENIVTARDDDVAAVLVQTSMATSDPGDAVASTRSSATEQQAPTQYSARDYAKIKFSPRGGGDSPSKRHGNSGNSNNSNSPPLWLQQYSVTVSTILCGRAMSNLGILHITHIAANLTSLDLSWCCEITDKALDILTRVQSGDEERRVLTAVFDRKEQGRSEAEKKIARLKDEQAKKAKSSTTVDDRDAEYELYVHQSKVTKDVCIFSRDVHASCLRRQNAAPRAAAALALAPSRSSMETSVGRAPGASGGIDGNDEEARVAEQRLDTMAGRVLLRKAYAPSSLCHTLRKLRLSENEKVTDKGIAVLFRLKALEDLELRSCAKVTGHDPTKSEPWGLLGFEAFPPPAMLGAEVDSTMQRLATFQPKPAPPRHTDATENTTKSTATQPTQPRISKKKPSDKRSLIKKATDSVRVEESSTLCSKIRGLFSSSAKRKTTTIADVRMYSENNDDDESEEEVGDAECCGVKTPPSRPLPPARTEEIASLALPESVALLAVPPRAIAAAPTTPPRSPSVKPTAPPAAVPSASSSSMTAKTPTHGGVTAESNNKSLTAGAFDNESSVGGLNKPSEEAGQWFPPELSRVSLYGSHVSPEGLLYLILSCGQTLKTLDLSHCLGLTPEAKMTGDNGILTMSLFACWQEDGGSAAKDSAGAGPQKQLVIKDEHSLLCLRACSQLETLILNGCGNISEVALKSLFASAPSQSTPTNATAVACVNGSSKPSDFFTCTSAFLTERGAHRLGKPRTGTDGRAIPPVITVAVTERLCFGALRSLDLCRCLNVTDKVLSTLAQNPQLRQTIEELSLGLCSDITDVGLLPIGCHMKHLSTIDLTSCSKITDRGVAALSGAIDAFSELDVSTGDKKGSTAEKLTGVLPRPPSSLLQCITLHGCHEITNVTCDFLAGFPAIRKVDVKRCQSLTVSGIERALLEARTLQVLSAGGVGKEVTDNLDAWRKAHPKIRFIM